MLIYVFDEIHYWILLQLNMVWKCVDAWHLVT